MFTATLFTIAKIRKQPKYPPISEWGKRLVYTYTDARVRTMVYHSAIKNYILPYATIWINLEGIMLSKSGKYHMTSYMESRRAGCGVVG